MHFVPALLVTSVYPSSWYRDYIRREMNTYVECSLDAFAASKPLLY